MRAVSLLVVLTLTASPALAQQPAPIRASIEKAAEAAAQTPAQPMSGNASAQKSGLFWSGLALGCRRRDDVGAGPDRIENRKTAARATRPPAPTRPASL